MDGCVINARYGVTWRALCRGALVRKRRCFEGASFYSGCLCRLHLRAVIPARILFLMKTLTNAAATKSLKNLDKLIAAETKELNAAKTPGEALACRNALRDLATRRVYLAAQVG